MFNIGNLRIEGPLVLAPMAGYTDSPFRRISKQFGASLVITELISAEGIVRNNKKTEELLRFTNQERPIGIQIFGSDPDIMAEASKILYDLGPDLIDINMGCSARRVLRGGAGAALLSKPDILEEMVSKIVKNVNIPISAKIRIGIDNDNKNYVETIKRLEGSGISLISVHGRTRAQGFSGEADWNIIKEIKEMSNVPILGNGDIKSYNEALSILKKSGCDAVMIGRGAIGNPWIFSGKNPEKKELIEQIKTHLRMMLDFYGDKGIYLMRKHIVKYIRGLNNSAKLRAMLVNATTEEEIASHLNSI